MLALPTHGLPTTGAKQRLAGACLLIAALALGLARVAHGEASDTSDFKKRVRAYFVADAGKPLARAAKRPPLEPGRGNYTRHYSFSIVGFAARCFHNNEQLAEANAALAENARHYLDNPKDIVDRDSFHWHADIVMRLISMYGPSGSAHAGRLTAETAALCLEPIWLYVKQSLHHNTPNHKETNTWVFHSTENHHAMDFTLQWHFTGLAKDHPAFKDRPFDDGSNIAQRYRDWSDYIVVYCRERARKGTNIEIMCPGYNSVWLKGFYNFRDFGEPEVRRAATLLLDLYWAYWAQEQLHGVAGGGKTRIRGVNGFTNHKGGIAALGWMYFGVGEQPREIDAEINALLSDYQPPAIVADIARSNLARGPFEIRQRAQGLGETGNESAISTSQSRPNRFRTDGGGILRYSYCEPAFIIGSLMTEARPLKDWTAISAQSRWQGVIFSDAPGARIVPVVRPSGRARDVLNGHWAVQSKGSMITQKLKGHDKGGDMIVWVSQAGLGKPVSDGAWVFVEAKGAYAAIRVTGGDYALSTDTVRNGTAEGTIRSAPPGTAVVLKDAFAPVILEVIAKERFKDFDDFKARIKACALTMDGPVLRYQTIYGDSLSFDSSQATIPTINGKPVDYAPPLVHDSPFIQAKYDTGVVTLRNGDQSLVLDFVNGTKTASN